MQEVIEFIGLSLASLIGVILYLGIVLVIGRSSMNRVPRLRNVRFNNAHWRSVTPTRLRWFGRSFGCRIPLRTKISTKKSRQGLKNNLLMLITATFAIPLTVILGLLVLSWALGMKTSGGAYPWLNISIYIGNILVCGYTVVKLTRCVRLLRRKRTQLMTASASEAQLADTRSPVLLLRSFRDDGREVKMLDDGALGASFEDALVNQLSKFGPTIAVGKPDEVLPPLGANREYVTGDWQQRIRQLMSEAVIIVVILDRTPGLLWEIEQVFASNQQHRLIIIAPDEGIFELTRRWRAVVRVASSNQSNNRVLRI